MPLNTRPRVILWGDSLTEGKPGVGFAPRLAASLPALDFENYGRGGDTVQSLKKRLFATPVPVKESRADLALLWVGVNDVMVDLLPGYGLLKSAVGQPPTRSPDDFSMVFSEVLVALRRYSQRILVLPPLFIGEDPRTSFNQRLEILSRRIKKIADKQSSTRFFNLRDQLPLDSIPPSSFVPVNPWARLADGIIGMSDEEYDLASLRRGLKWTYDGVHLNSTGANRVADTLNKIIREELAWKENHVMLKEPG